MATSKSKKVIGKRISNYKNPGIDSKSGLYKAKQYDQFKAYKPRPYDITKTREFKPKEFKSKPLQDPTYKQYEPKYYEHYYEYDPDYKEVEDRPKPVRQRTPAPRSPRPSSKTPLPSSPKMQELVIPKGLNPLPSIRRQLYLYRTRGKVTPHQMTKGDLPES